MARRVVMEVSADIGIVDAAVGSRAWVKARAEGSSGADSLDGRMMGDEVGIGSLGRKVGRGYTSSRLFRECLGARVASLDWRTAVAGDRSHYRELAVSHDECFRGYHLVFCEHVASQKIGEEGQPSCLSLVEASVCRERDGDGPGLLHFGEDCGQDSDPVPSDGPSRFVAASLSTRAARHALVTVVSCSNASLPLPSFRSCPAMLLFLLLLAHHRTASLRTVIAAGDESDGQILQPGCCGQSRVLATSHYLRLSCGTFFGGVVERRRSGFVDACGVCGDALTRRESGCIGGCATMDFRGDGVNGGAVDRHFACGARQVAQQDLLSRDFVVVSAMLTSSYSQRDAGEAVVMMTVSV